MDCCSAMDPTTQPFDFLVLLGMGFTISLGHCVGMCGPLVGAFAMHQQRRGVSSWGLALRSLVYHVGRATSYVLLGAAMGLLGATVFLGSDGRRVQGAFSIVIAAVMVALAFGLLGWVRTPRFVENSGWTNAVGCRIRELLDAPTLGRSYALGFANGWLPCGPVFAAAMTAASTGSVWKGAVAMAAFALGTFPVLIALSMGSGRLGLSARAILHRVGAFLVLLVGVQLLLRGLAAWGFVQHLRFGEVVIW